VTERNIRLYYVLESILSLTGGIILPVYVVYFRNFDITLFQVAFLAALFEATIIIFEVPTGYFADRFGRRLSTLIGFFLYALSGFIFFQYTSFEGFIVAEIIFGVAETFISGALEALAVDSLNESDRKNRLSSLFANRTVFKTSALLIGMISGGFLAGYYLSGLFAPFIIIASVGLVLSLFLKEEKSIIKSEHRQKKNSLFTKQLSFRNPLVPALFAVGLFSNFAYEPADQFWQVLFSEIKIFDVSHFGILTAAGLILVVSIVKLSEKLYDKRLSLYLSSCFLLIAVSLYLAAGSSVYPAIAGMVIYFALKELIRPAISTHLNRALSSERRATYLSVYNMTCSVGEVVAGITAGLLAKNFGVIFVFYFSAIAAVIVIAVYLVISRFKK